MTKCYIKLGNLTVIPSVFRKYIYIITLFFGAKNDIIKRRLQAGYFLRQYFVRPVLSRLRRRDCIINKQKTITIVCGHYGSGKTNVAVNLALRYKKEAPEKNISVADVDIVNPYFRTADAREILMEAGVIPLIPEFANSNVDIPSLPHRLTALFSGNGGMEESTIIDVGGDEGAVALGMYSQQLNRLDYDMIYVINKYRPLTADPKDAADLMREIEGVSNLKCTRIVNNSSLGAETTAEDILESVEYARECAELCGLPLLFHAYYADLLPSLPEDFAKAGYGSEPLFPMRNVTRKLF